MGVYECIADLTVDIESYELEGLERDVSSDFTRLSTLIHMRGGAEEGAKISVNDLIVKAAARSLAKFPTLNASYAGDTLTLQDEINVAVAVAIQRGLVRL